MTSFRFMEYQRKERSEQLMDDWKMTKSRAYLCQAVNTITSAGIIIFFIGVYYCMVRAGIPCQDPPLELQIEYAVNMGIGETLVKDGLLISICAGAVRLLLKLVFKKTNG